MRTQRARYPGAPIHSKGRSGHPRVVRAIKILSLCVAVVMVLGAGYLGWVGWHRSRPIALPVPTGTYPVGRRMYDWTDPSRRDNLRSPSGTARELSVWLWYPATLIPGSSRATYAPGAWQALHMAAPVGFFEGPLDNMATHSSDNAPIAAGPFPVVILEPGMGLAALQLTALAESVASHGYVVAGITPTDSANVTVIHNRVVPATTLGNPPDIGRDASTADHILRAWVGDAQFTRSQLGRLNLAGPLASHLTLTHASYVGHSFGGAAALQACHDDRQCAVAVDLVPGATTTGGVPAGADRWQTRIADRSQLRHRLPRLHALERAPTAAGRHLEGVPRSTSSARTMSRPVSRGRRRPGLASRHPHVLG